MAFTKVHHSLAKTNKFIFAQNPTPSEMRLSSHNGLQQHMCLYTLCIAAVRN